MKRLFSLLEKKTPGIFGVKWHWIFMIFLFSCSNSDDYTRELAIQSFPDRTEDFSLWQLEPFFQEVQMGYIIRTDDGKVVVVDGGGAFAAPYLESYLKQLGGTVHTWIITHGHTDHVNALLEILAANTIHIERLLHAPPDSFWVIEHEQIAANTFSRYLNTVQTSSIPLLVPQKEAVYELGKGVQIEIISTTMPDITWNAINNSSLVFKISSKSKSILFLGDMGPLGGKKIMEITAPEKLRADYVQMAHHGQEGVDKEFYRLVGAKYALWPTPEWLWNNRADQKGYDTGNHKTLSVRRWMEELRINKNYVSGLEGTVQID
ncbi:MBL fold metallo-hydrolase [Flavobacteriaceae bacterium TP-CH-4]|uniref:MBL fold metallo-hydrolase n=1 Tax=Pelagihabitans pacificus TaxID=2696054 RepID=A0A967ATU2_9FLAO|nr:MBL fold metallo-hydrolase [Pelagihabitans pacificus]NHF59080.1 MBL fold metallo-hydrolase [Pelagihabitans pacificus]